jgi:coenzyme A diphosphatase NUDT7
MTKNEKVLLENIIQALHKATPQAERELKLWDAAVMLPLVETREGLSILFQVRSMKLNWQPGDICFPGGRREPEDGDLSVTAQREMEEELGLTKDDYSLLGPLDYFYTYVGPMLFPYVGIIHNPENIKLSTEEVAEIFTVPIAKLLKIQPRSGTITIASKPEKDFPFDVLPEYKEGWTIRKNYKVYCYDYEKRRIWGMTARVLHGFLTKIKAL